MPVVFVRCARLVRAVMLVVVVVVVMAVGHVARGRGGLGTQLRLSGRRGRVGDARWTMPVVIVRDACFGRGRGSRGVDNRARASC